MRLDETVNTRAGAEMLHQPIQKDALVGSVLGIAFVVSSLAQSEARPLGWVFLLAVLSGSSASFGLTLVARRLVISKRLAPVLVWFLIFVAINALSLLYCATHARSLYVLGELVLTVGFFFGLSIHRWSPAGLRTVADIESVGFVIPQLLACAFAEFPRGFRSYFLNANGFGAYAFSALFYIAVARELTARKTVRRFWWTVLSVACIVLIGLSSSRSAWLALVISILTYVVWDRVTASRFVYMFYGAGLLTATSICLILYTAFADNLRTSPLVIRISQMTGENVFSGRHAIWLAVVRAIGDSPLLGYGVGTSPGTLWGLGLSSHNLYLQIALQVGVLGLLVFLVCLYQIWRALWYGRHDPVVRLSSAFFIGCLVHQMFEVSLTQNSLSIGLMQWSIAAVGLSRVMAREGVS